MSSEPEHTPRESRLNEGIPKRLIAACAVFLGVIVFAVTLPDILNYCLLKQQMELRSGHSQANPLTAQRPPMPYDPIRTNTSGIALSESQSKAAQLSPEKVFESYGRFLTLIVGLLSVLGVFFGYFVQKSLRETEKDLNDKLDKSVGKFETEGSRLTKDFSDNAKKFEEKLREVTALEARVRKMEQDVTKAVEALNKSALTPTDAPPKLAFDTKEATQALDAELKQEKAP